MFNNTTHHVRLSGNMLQVDVKDEAADDYDTYCPPCEQRRL
jgi:hypothetical protein